MQAKLIVFSILYVAPPTFKLPYGVGIAEYADGGRSLVRIKEEYFDDLRNGLEGEVREEDFDNRRLNFFYPRK